MTPMDAIDELLYMAGSFVCPSCDFRLQVRAVNLATGQVGIRKGGEEGGLCPNCNRPLDRLTWKSAYFDSAESAHEIMLALIESVKLQSHYATLLNNCDGGRRMTFSSPGEWIARLLEIGAIPNAYSPSRKRAGNVSRGTSFTYNDGEGEDDED